MSKSLTLVPRMSEKAYGMSQTLNTYVFDIPKHANKHTVARAVSSQLEVTVVNVNIVNITGKTKRTVRKGGRPVKGRQSDVKKAYVTLKQGDALPLFAGIEESEAKSQKLSAAVEKVAEKQAKKESK